MPRLRLNFFCATIFVLFVSINGNRPCSKLLMKNEIYCVCNETYCDTYEDVLPKHKHSYIITSTSKAGLRFDTTEGSISKNKKLHIFIHDYVEILNKTEKPDHVRVTIDFNKRKQEIIGFGAAFTGSVSYLLGLMSKALQHQIYKTYYSKKEGINYNLLRYIIGGCDYDLIPWAYAETPENDRTLSGFTHLNELDLTRIKQLRELERISQNYNIKKIGTAWTSPKWMKTNYTWEPKNRLQPKYYQTFAEYYLRWLRLMAGQGVKLWGMSLLNNPSNGIENWKFINFSSLGLTAFEQGIWLGGNFGPLIRNSEFADLKLFGMDDQMYFLPWYYSQMEKGYPNSTKYLDGLAQQWYADQYITPRVLDEFHEMYPNQMIINSESSLYGNIGRWANAELYTTRLIRKFRHHVQGWMDWNFVLDMEGGPNYASNYVLSAININTTNPKEFYKNSIFYAMAHFSKFLEPGSVNVKSCSSHYSIQTAAFERPDKTVIVILFNKFPTPVHIKYNDSNGLYIHLRLPPKSVHTLAIKN